MKKIATLVLAITLLVTSLVVPSVAFAEETAFQSGVTVFYNSSDNTVNVSGNLTNWNDNQQVTLLMVPSGTDVYSVSQADIGYIEQKKSTDGTFSFVYNLPSGYNLDSDIYLGGTGIAQALGTGFSSTQFEYVYVETLKTDKTTATATAKVKNFAQEPKSAVMVLTQYDAQGNLLKVNYEVKTIAKETFEFVECSITADEVHEDMDYMRAFVWDSFDGMTPIYTPAETVKVLIIGNSITQHDPSESIGWYGDWGMAATTAEKDYVHRLMAAAGEKYDNVEFMTRNIATYEMYFYDLSIISSSAFKDLVQFDADVIISTFGANIKNGANEGDSAFENDKVFKAQHYVDIVNTFNVDNNAEVIVGLTPLTKAENLAVIEEAAEQEGWTLVDMSDLTGDEYTAIPYKDEGISTGAFDETVVDGVLTHPGDKAMEIMAERLWPELDKAIGLYQN